MKIVLMFTAYELIICVTPRATGSEFALSEKKQNHSTLDPTVFRWVLQCEIQREETAYFFSQSEHKGHWDECETILLNKVVT